MKGQLPIIPDDDVPVLINHTKITDNLEELFICATYVIDKQCTVVYAQYELDTGRCTQHEVFNSAAVPSFVAIGANYDLVVLCDKLVKHACDEHQAPVKVVKYKWRQSMSEIVVFVELEAKPTKNQIDIKIERSKLQVNVANGLKERVEFGGELFDQIDVDGSNWEISPGGIEITLQKGIERGWQSVLEQEADCGEEVFNEEFVAQVRDRLSHLTSDHPMPQEAEKPGVDGHQLEDCDRVSEFERIVYRFCIQERSWSHKASLASNAPILTSYLDKNVKALGIRMDVDCCIWDTEDMDAKTPLNHIATFDGVGYIHAGKTGLAFAQISPDNKYLVLVDIARRAVIYRNMKENKVLLIKTRRGKIMRILREQYLRDDIDDGIGSKLDQKPVKTGHWILPDTNVFLNNMDCIEQPQFDNLIILQTVQSELKRRSVPNYKRLKTMISSGKKCIVFVNEFCVETHAKRVKGESSNDYNDRLIRKATSYYDRKGLKWNTRCLLLTNDRDNAKKAAEAGLEAATIGQYVRQHHQELIDKISGGQESTEVDRNIDYKAHVSLTQVQVNIKAGTLIQGKLSIRRDNYLEGTVLDGDKGEILVSGRNNLNRAMNEDVVALRMKPQNEWKAPSSRFLDQELQPGADEAAQQASNTAENEKKMPTAEVVAIVKEAGRLFF